MHDWGGIQLASHAELEGCDGLGTGTLDGACTVVGPTGEAEVDEYAD
jgi:hypothetical protein